MSPIVRFLLILAHLSIFIILLFGNDNYTSKENTISTKDAPAYESLLISQSDLETKSQEELLKAQAAIYSNQLKLKEALTGHYFGFNEEEESVYIELTPYVYKKFMFKGQIDLESYANPEIGLWGVTENEQILLEKILSEDDTIEFTPFTIKEGALIYDEKEIHLDKVGPNFVPGLFHFQRSLDYEEGYFSSYDSSGQISVQNNFPDNKLIFNQEALDLTKLGYMYQHGKLFYDGKNGNFTDQTLVAEEEFIDDDVGMAFTLYQKAAKLNYPPAMHNLASLYYEGKVEGNKMIDMQLTNYSFLDSRSHYLEAQSNHKVSMKRLSMGTKLERSGSDTGALSQSMRSRFEMMGDRSFITNLQNTRSFLNVFSLYFDLNFN